MHDTNSTTRRVISQLAAPSTLAFALGLASSAVASGPNGNTTPLCHVSGNGTVSLLYVNQNALAAHLAHGDHLPLTFFADLDGDGYGDPNSPVSACLAPSNYVGNADDCEDQDAAINPGAAEICDDGIDNNCDGQVDEGCSLINYGSCPVPTEFTTCAVDLTNGTFACDNGTPLALLQFNIYGPVYTLDMTDWDVAIVDVDVQDPSGWWLHLGNSRTNNGWSGDSGQTSNDSEAQLFGNSLTVFRSDLGGSGVALSQGTSVDPAGDAVTMVVCDGYFGWDSSTASADQTDSTIFQIDGDELDPERGSLNDRQMWLGVGQTVGTASRNGSGVTGLTITFGR